MSNVWRVIFLCLISSVSTVVSAYQSGDFLVGTVDPKGRYVFDLPKEIAGCSADVSKKAGDYFYPRERLVTAPKGMMVSWNIKPQSIGEALPEVIQEVLSSQWVTAGSPAKLLTLEAVLLYSETNGPCWQLRTPDWFEFELEPNQRNYETVLAHKLSNGTLKFIKPKQNIINNYLYLNAKEEWCIDLKSDVISAIKQKITGISCRALSIDLQTVDMLKSFDAIPALKKELIQVQAEQKKATYLAIASMQRFNSAIKGKNQNFVFSTITSMPETRFWPVMVVVNFTTKTLCAFESKDYFPHFRLLGLASSLNESTDVWVVGMQYWEGYQIGIFQPVVSDSGKCEMKEISRTSYSGL